VTHALAAGKCSDLFNKALASSGLEGGNASDLEWAFSQGLIFATYFIELVYIAHCTSVEISR
jgi:hypothetical protein